HGRGVRRMGQSAARRRRCGRGHRAAAVARRSFRRGHRFRSGLLQQLRGIARDLPRDASGDAAGRPAVRAHFRDRHLGRWHRRADRRAPVRGRFRAARRQRSKPLHDPRGIACPARAMADLRSQSRDPNAGCTARGDPRMDRRGGEAMIIDWRKVAVAPQASLLEALRVIDGGAIQFALVVDGQKLVGVVTDGDVRRALVRGLDTEAAISEAMNRTPVLGSLAEGPAGWRRKMRKHSVRHLPVVDEAGMLLRLATDQAGSENRDNWVVLMAGGLGTRLRPITESIPKPMVEVGGRPILETIVETLAHSGFQRLFLSVNYRAELIEGHFGDGGSYGLQIEYLR